MQLVTWRVVTDKGHYYEVRYLPCSLELSTAIDVPGRSSLLDADFKETGSSLMGRRGGQQLSKSIIRIAKELGKESKGRPSLREFCKMEKRTKTRGLVVTVWWTG